MGKHGSTRVLALPGRRNRKRNPFNFLLSEALAVEGCEVIDLDDQNGWTVNSDIFHIHWPQHAARGRLVRALRKSSVLVGLILMQRLRGARIVWTVHNVRGHDQNHPFLEDMLMWAVIKLAHGVIFLSSSSRSAACAEIPALSAKPFAVIPHGLYGLRSEKTREAAREAFGLSSAARVVGFLGDVKQYKGLDRLLDVFEETPLEGVTLFVAGAFTDRDRRYGTNIRARIAALAGEGRSIVFREERLEDAALVDAIRASDIVALPYHAAWNSGFALLVVENGGRILASNAPVFRELQSEVGPEQVFLFDGDLRADVLAAALDEMPAPNDERAALFSAARSWPRIGTETMAFYRQLGARPGREMSHEV